MTHVGAPLRRALVPVGPTGAPFQTREFQVGALRTSIAGAVVGTVAAAGLYTGVVSPAVNRTSATSSDSTLAASVPHAPKVVVTVKAAPKAAPKPAATAQETAEKAAPTVQKVQVVHVAAAPKPRSTSRRTAARRAAAAPAPRRTSSSSRQTHHEEAEDEHEDEHEDGDDEHEHEDD